MKTFRNRAVSLWLLLLSAVTNHAASLLADGNFDNLPVGTAPDVNVPAGHWYWPADYQLAGIRFAGETNASQVSIVPAPAGGTGNALRLSFTATETLGRGGTWTKLLDVLAQPTDRTESVTDTNAVGPARFYRVVTPRRP